MSSKQANWDIAPDDATHHGYINNGDCIAWYKYHDGNGYPIDAHWSVWYSTNGFMDKSGWKALPAGQAPLQLPLTPRPKYAEKPKPESIKWHEGIDLPPVGLTVEIKRDLLEKDSKMFKWNLMKGTEVTIIHHIIADQNSSDKDVAVYLVKHDGSYRVRQSVASVFKRAKTPEEKAILEAKRIMDERLSEIGKSLNISTLSFTEQNILEKLYKAGYLK